MICATCLDSMYYSTCPSVVCFNVKNLATYARCINHDFILKEADLYAFTETWTQDSEPPVELEHFSLVSRNNCGRNRAGGVAIYKRKTAAKDDLEILSVPKLDMDDLMFADVCAAQYSFKKDGSSTVVTYVNVYVSPKPKPRQEQIMALLKTIVKNFEPDERLVIGGDFNFEWNDRSGLYTMENIVRCFGLVTISPVDVTTVYQTRIDIVFARNFHAAVIPFVSYFSDHRPLILVSEVAPEDKRRPSTRSESSALVSVIDPESPLDGCDVLIYDTDSEEECPRSNKISDDEEEEDE